MVSSHEPENSCEVLVYLWSKFVTASSVHVFKEVYRTNFSQITYKASAGMEGERMHVFFADWIGTLAYIASLQCYSVLSDILVKNELCIPLERGSNVLSTGEGFICLSPPSKL